MTVFTNHIVTNTWEHADIDLKQFQHNLILREHFFIGESMAKNNFLYHFAASKG